MTPERDRQLERTREVFAERDEQARAKAKQGQLGNAGGAPEDGDEAPRGEAGDEKAAEESSE